MHFVLHLLIAMWRYSANPSLLQSGCMLRYLFSDDSLTIRIFFFLAMLLFALLEMAQLFYLLLDSDLFTLCTSPHCGHLCTYMQGKKKTFHPSTPSVSLDYILFCQCCITKEAVKAHHHLLVPRCLYCFPCSFCH